MDKNTTLIQLVDDIRSGKLKAENAVQYYLNNISKSKEFNAVVEVFEDAIGKAKELDQRIARGEKVGKLAGAPIIIKDNMLYRGKKACCASKFLQDFVSPYTATTVQHILDEDAIIIGRANMDEFAMGGSNEYSCYGPCHNSRKLGYVSGGSSGGSACAVGADLCVAALGSDTGGSVREPSAYNGVVGMKPTYGRNSRYGIVAFASSLDQVGPITKCVKDNALLLEVLAGQDSNDDTTLRVPVPKFSQAITGSIQGMKIGLCQQIADMFAGNEYEALYNKIYAWAQTNGATIVPVDIKNIELSLPTYYIIAPAEATSNLGRFDGIRYTTRSNKATTVEEIYSKSRTEGFGKEVKRRIMLGNFVLSSGYFDAYYNKAKAVQKNISDDFEHAFTQCDVLLMPTTAGEAFKIGSKSTDPVEMYLVDLFTVPSNIAGVPAMSVPCGLGKTGLPLGLQIYAKKENEGAIYNFADYFEVNYKEGK